MFKHCYRLFRTTNIKPLSAERFCATSSREKWDLFTAVCLERKPVITPALAQLENDYKAMLGQLEFERSLKSDFEIRHETELKQMEQLKKGEDVEIHLKQTAQETIDGWTEEFSLFKFADKITEADKKNDVKSLDRKLDKHLVFVVKQKVGKDHLYLLPQALRQDGETLRQTAERILKDTCGIDTKASIYGNAPCGFYKYKYPKPVAKESKAIGAKVFIYFARYETGQLNCKDLDYKWLDREELDKILPLPYKNSLSQMLIDE